MLPTSGIMLIFIFAVYGVLFAYLIFTYVMQGIALQTIAKRRGIAHPWLAWVPYGVNWILGAIASEYDLKNGIKRRWDKVLLTVSVIIAAFEVLSYVAIFIGIIWTAMNMSGYMSEEDVLLFAMFMYIALIPSILLLSVFSTLATIRVFKIFESTVPEKALIYFLIYLLVPFAAPICLFACRNKGYEVTSEDNLIVEQVSFE